MASFTIGQLSRETGVNTETIRYFEKVGLLSSPPRTGGGHRIYGEDHRRTVGFIRRARELGFTPEEVRGILALGGPADACCDEVREIASRHLQKVQSKMADLARMERLLASTIERCSGDHAPKCAVISMIEDEPVGRQHRRSELGDRLA
ncbi:MerR family transcriptional regulator [Allosphingosinicella sp.]|uniref:MerR family transcriptional regulator n=1 Tax=Allosphingosinicella sp. TaxID=2823234 RepID=UPI002FC1629F